MPAARRAPLAARRAPLAARVAAGGLLAGGLVVGLAVVAAAGCRRPGGDPPAPWLYDATLALGPRPPVSGGFGRGVRPVSLRPAGIVAAEGVAGGPAAIEELIAADDGAAEAVAFGEADVGTVLELIDVDAGVVRWRNATARVTPRSLAGDVVIAGDDHRTVAIDRATGIDRWRHDGAYRARDGHTIAIAGEAGLLLVDSATGEAVGPLSPPAGWPAGAVIAVCEAPTLHLYAHRNGQLARWEVDGGELRARWLLGVPAPTRRDACGETVLLVAGEPRAAVALDPDTGAVVGGPVEARELWPARGGPGVELATPAGVEWRDRRLAAPRPLEEARVGRLLARHGDRRLVARGDGGLVLLDGHGARALAEPYGVGRAALGARFVIGGPWAMPVRTHASRLTRWELPTADEDAEPTPPAGRVLIGDAPRIDPPPPVPLPDGVALDEAGAWAVGAGIVDAHDPARILVHVLEDRPDAQRGAGVAAFDLDRAGGGAWRWHAADACPPGMAVALAATARLVLCGARQTRAGTGAVRAVDRDSGRQVWEWRGTTVDGLLAASPTRAAVGGGGPADPGELIVVLDGARLVALDPDRGAERASWYATDGWLPRVALLRRPTDVLLAAPEHGHLVVRSAALGLRPMTAVEIRGVPSGLFAVGERVALTLADGSAYLVDPRGEAVAAAGLSPGWEPAGDQAAILTTNEAGDGVLVGHGVDGVPRVAVAVPGSGPLALAHRATVPAAPFALLGGAAGLRVTAVTADGAPARVLDLPPEAARTPVVSTAIDDRPVVAVVLARPLRLVRVDLR